MPGRSLSSLLSCPWFSRISKRSWPRLAGLLGAICLAAAAHAQTAHFSYALQTLLSGLRAEGVAVDAAGNLYVGAFNQTAVFKGAFRLRLVELRDDGGRWFQFSGWRCAGRQRQSLCRRLRPEFGA